jgi:hypothetical protein
MQMTSRWVAALLACVVASAAPGAAGAFEDPPVTRAATVLGAQASGPNYHVDPEVRSDGLVHLFQLKTASGTYEIGGDDFMRMRIRELGALRTLQQMSESDLFLKSLGQTAAAPLRFGADLITDPAATVKRSASGIANMFDRIGAGISNNKANRDNPVTSVLGIDSARRALAVSLKVDPYTDFPPLASKLNDVATASALGGLSMKGLMMAIPGGAGVAVSSTSTVDTIAGTLVEKTSAQIVEGVLGQLQRRGVSRDAAARLVQNRAYTPADLLLMTRAVLSLKGGSPTLFIARAAEAPTREEAFFQRRRAELLASNAKAMGIGGFVDVAGFPLNRLADGRLIALFPFDEVAWTERTAATFTAVARAAANEQTKPVLAITGALTPLAGTEMLKLGWTVERVN